MITLDLILKNIRLFAIILVAGLLVWFYKDWQFQKAENIRQTENANQLRKADSLKYASQILTSQELANYLEYQNKDLQAKLKSDGIKTNRIKEIISTNYVFKDTTFKNFTGKFTDTSKCLTIRGEVLPNGTVNITDREFKNKTDAVAFWERRQWKFLGIKTRFLGKKEMTAKVYDQCGTSQTIKIEKKE